MIDYRACSKCRGDMHTRQDTYGVFKECIQCGMMQDLELEKNSKALAETGAPESKKGEAA